MSSIPYLIASTRCCNPLTLSPYGAQPYTLLTKPRITYCRSCIVAFRFPRSPCLASNADGTRKFVLVMQRESVLRGSLNPSVQDLSLRGERMLRHLAQVIYAAGKSSVRWLPSLSKHNAPVFHAIFDRETCQACDLRGRCTRAKRRRPTLRPRPRREALQAARQPGQTDAI
jgi:hypothetical protein